MRVKDLDKLKDPYPGTGSTNGMFEKAIGLNLNAVEALASEVRQDRDPINFGIRWWSDFDRLSLHSRILISDYLDACIRSIGDHLVHAKLHLMEFDHFHDKTSELSNASFAQDSGGTPRMHLHRQQSAFQELPSYMLEVNRAGLLRALGSALDCLGASIVGVLGLPIEIFRAGFKKAINHTPARRQRSQTEALAQIEEFIESSGPPGWLDWTLNYRNSLVHRATRISMSTIEPKAILGVNGQPVSSLNNRPIVRFFDRQHLPSDPDLSDIEVFARQIAGRNPVITEDSSATLHGVFASSLKLIEETAEILDVFWVRRRSKDRGYVIQQPATQWPIPRKAEVSVFTGYSPGKYPYNPRSVTSAPSLLFRLKSSSLAVEDAGNWIGHTSELIE